jgi:hypothetical protein
VRSILLFLILGLLGGATASATDYVIQPDGSGSFPTINDAIAFAVDGDRVLLADGVYQGVGNRLISFLGKAITLASVSGNPSECVIDVDSPPNLYRSGVTFESGEGPDSILEGITIARARGFNGGAVYCAFSSPTVRNCIFRENTALQGGAIDCGFSDAVFEDCVIVNNRAEEFPGGGASVGEGRVAFVRCTFAFNESGIDPGGKRQGGGIHAYDAGVFIRNCIIASSTRGEGVSCESGSASLLCTNIFGNVGGDWIGCIADQLGQSGNISADPIFCNPALGDFTLQSDSPCLPEHSGCGLMGALGVGCGATSIDAMTWGKIKSLYRIDVSGRIALPGR